MIAELRKIHFGDVLANELGVAKPAAEEMMRAHAHHVLQKLGAEGSNRELVAEGFEILRRNDRLRPREIIKGLANLVWAPNIPGQHGTDPLRKVLQELRNLDKAGGTRKQFLELLQKLGDEAANLGKAGS